MNRRECEVLLQEFNGKMRLNRAVEISHMTVQECLDNGISCRELWKAYDRVFTIIMNASNVDKVRGLLPIEQALKGKLNSLPYAAVPGDLLL